MISKSFNLFKISLALLLFFFASGFTVIGHRGDPINAPEETFESFDKAFAEGADYVELDIHVSKDNVLVVSHDRDLERVTGTSAIVSQHNFSDLASLKQKNGESIHSLNQVFEHYKNNPKAKFLIETKKTKKVILKIWKPYSNKLSINMVCKTALCSIHFPLRVWKTKLN
jgi:Glycerophosphoryl diester phosphodiesterase